MGRFSPRGRGSNGRRSNHRGGRGRYKSNSYNSNNSSKPKVKTGLKDYMHHVGSAQQASECITVTNYLINHIRKEFDKGGDIARALEKLEDIIIEPPVIENMTKLDAKAFERLSQAMCERHAIRLEQCQDNKDKACALIWGQCDKAMRSKMQSRKDYELAVKDDPIELLKAVKQHALAFQDTKYELATIVDCMKALINMKQKDDEALLDFKKRFKTAIS